MARFWDYRPAGPARNEFRENLNRELNKASVIGWFHLPCNSGFSGRIENPFALTAMNEFASRIFPPLWAVENKQPYILIHAKAINRFAKDSRNWRVS
jgi:hypothetical protein